MTDRGHGHQFNLAPEPLTGTLITTDEARRVAHLVLSRYPDEPWVARYLLEVLGLLDATPATTDPEQ